MFKYSYLLFTIGLMVAPLSGLSYSTAVSSFTENPHLNSDSLIFRNGKEAYANKIRQFRYPMSAAKEGVQGTMVFKLTVKPDGTMDAALLTDLGDDINESVALSISELQNEFLVKDESYSVYQVLFFGLQHDYYASFKEDLEGFKMEFEFPWLEPTSITVRSIVRPAQRISSTGRSSWPTAKSNVPPSPSGPSEGYQLKSYLSDFKKYEKFSDKGSTKKAYKAVTELIRFNPFDLELIEARIRIEKELGLNTFGTTDIQLAASLAESK